jgi:hypothetical protein
MAITISTQYRRPTDGSNIAINVQVDVASFRPQSADRDQLGDDVYLKVSAGSATPWYRKITGHISDAIRAYTLGIDGGTSVTASNGGTPSNSLSDDGVEGVLTQLEKPASPTSVDASASGGGEVVVQFIESASAATVVAGYYFFHSADCISWTRLASQTGGSGKNSGCIAKGLLSPVTVLGVAKKQYTLVSVPTGTKYIGATAVGSTSETSEFPESAVAFKVAPITVS